MVRKTENVTALLGWSLQAIEAIDKMNRSFIVVGPSELKEFADTNGIPLIQWDFSFSIEKADELYEMLKEYSVTLAVPIYEETVEWAGILNAKLRNNPRLYNKAPLLTDRNRIVCIFS